MADRLIIYQEIAQAEYESPNILVYQIIAQAEYTPDPKLLVYQIIAQAEYSDVEEQINVHN